MLKKVGVALHAIGVKKPTHANSLGMRCPRVGSCLQEGWSDWGLHAGKIRVYASAEPTQDSWKMTSLSDPRWIQWVS